MLQFYNDFVDRYIERPLFQYGEMDTDSAYIALAGESIDGLVRADRRAHYFRRSPMDGHRVVLFRTQVFRQANAESIQGRMVRRRIRRFV